MSLKQQKQGSSTYWWPEQRTLVFLKEKATPEFWDQKWQTEDWRRKITQSRNSWSWFAILRKYLPNKNSRILEGGCGCGHLVDAMDYWGYQATGVDFAPETVAKIKEVMPHLDVHCGDVRALKYENDYFDGYWSLGVIEHFWNGYNDILKEMKRVLKTGGYVFVAFPCISRLDRIKIFFLGYNKFAGGDMPNSFYQFALDVSTVRKDFEHAGFQCVRIRRQNGWDGLKRLWPALEPVLDALIRLSCKSRPIKLFKMVLSILMAPLCGHSVMLVLRKR